MVLHAQLSLTSVALYGAIVVLVRDLGVGSLSMPTTNMGMQGLPVELSSHASATSSWVRQCVVSLGIGLINTFLTMRTVTHMEENAGIADVALQYNTSYVAAMHDLFYVIILVTMFGLFAISRMKYERPGKAN